MNIEQPTEGEISRASSPRYEAYLALLLELLQTIVDNETEPDKVYPILQANLHKLDDSFVEVLRNWAATTLPRLELVHALVIAAALVNFGNVLRSFPYGNIATNLEIATAGCEIAASVLTQYFSVKPKSSVKTAREQGRKLKTPSPHEWSFLAPPSLIFLFEKY